MAVGICTNCGEGPKCLPAKNVCGKCYDKLYPPHTRRKVKAYKRNKPNNGEFPKKILIPNWECSDGAEFTHELDALRYQLDLERRRTSKA